jgi:hypothetical protein
MSSDDLNALIIRNLHDLDAAVNRLYHDISDTIGRTIDEMAEKWAAAHTWDGMFHWKDNYDLWLSPSDWRASKDDPTSCLVFFQFYVGDGDSFDWKPNEDMFWLTRLCQAG